MIPYAYIFALYGQIDQKIPDEVYAMAGTFTGAWTVYGIDDTQNRVKRWAWIDTLTLENPVFEGKQAYIHARNEMVFEGGRPPYTVEFKEGYFLNADGSLGEAFVELFGQTYQWHKLAPNISAYSAPAHPQELVPLGFSNVSSAQHVFVKITTEEDGIETHRVSRVTNVNWKDSEKKDCFLHYTSMEGVHKRQAP